MGWIQGAENGKYREECNPPYSWYYFIQICGYEENDLHKIVLEQNKPLFVDEVEGQKPNYDRYNLASSMLTYMNDGPAVISDGFNYIDDDSDVE